MDHSDYLFTFGHSTHPLDEFVALLARHRIEAVVDIRRFPGSRRFPHFNREKLEESLRKAGVAYHWIEELGGRRSAKKDASALSRNLGLRNASFRNFADYMLTEEFKTGVAKLLEVARTRRTAFMCSEGLFWRCHRRLISDYLTAHERSIQHIMPSGPLQPHTLSNEAKVENGLVTYPPAEMQADLPFA